MLAQDIMTKEVLTFKESDTLETVANALATFGISGAPVVDSEGRVVGVISESDIMRRLKEIVDKEIGVKYMASSVHSLALFAFVAQKSSTVSQELFSKLGKVTVKETMTRRAITAKPEDSVEHVVSLMISNDIQRIPIVKNDKLIGIVSRADIIRSIPDLIR